MTDIVNDAVPAIVTLPVPLLASLCDTLARAAEPTVAFDAIGSATAALLGPGLLTINAYQRASSEVVRLWSSDTAAYPVGGRKRKADTPWTRRVLHQGEVFVGEGDAALEAVFDDISTIRGLALSAVVNVPVCERGRCVGTFNFLAARSAWTPGEVAVLRLFAQMVVPAVMAAGRAVQADH
ncbi:GAF domain-containing protein [Cupriavidus sp. CV2]|uniref:GAF domain-containing protein n=1 Tax=Cupriavidus ulmosensis TaxID=3065913 RepID=UPI00296B080A|nr:GAF domain-containing protein [Cupriavidus sp. CV2]MDW3685670.1 GAF domain-containing protein [Cupriavidus sp. CV2]